MHQLTVELEVIVGDEAHYPKLDLTYSYRPGSPGVRYLRNGDPGWPPEPAEIELERARLIFTDGLEPNDEQVRRWATEFVESDSGFCFLSEQAELDLDARAYPEV
jgi:hypothetical protein